MLRSILLTLGMMVLVACATAQPGDRAEPSLDMVEREMDVHDLNLAAASVRADLLVLGWAGVRRRLLVAAQDFSSAASLYAEVVTARHEERATLQVATRTYELARERWQWAQALIVVAAVVDASNLDSARGERLLNGSCDGMISTHAYRLLKGLLGVRGFGLDVDHIVPLALGGADHPDNYQVLGSGVNRSLGAQWGADKCAMAGAAKCARAVAISRKCGTFTGSMPTL